MTVRKSHRGRWMIDVKIKLPDGAIRRVRRVSPVQSKRGAQQFERDVRAEVLERARSGEEHDDGKQEPPPTLAAMWDEFIAFQRSPANKRPNRPRTVLENERMFRSYIEPLVGDRRVDLVTARVIDRLTTQLHDGVVSRRPLKHNSVANILGLLRRMLNVAKRWGHLDQVPEINTLKRSSERLEDDKWLTEDEATSFIGATEPRWLALVTVVVRTGLRVGELQGLQWSDVDLEGERLTVKRQWLEPLLEFGPPKGGKAREIPLTWDAVAALRKHRDQRRDDAFVFGDPHVAFQQDELRRALARAKRASGVTKHVHIHMLRHTWASHCILKGVPSRVVMLWGGWENEEMLKRYAHIAPREVETLIHRIAPRRAPLRVVEVPPTDRLGHHRGTAEEEKEKTGP